MCIQFVDIVNTQLVDTLLGDVTDSVVHWVEVGAVWWDEFQCCLLQKSDSVAGSAWKFNPAKR